MEQIVDPYQKPVTFQRVCSPQRISRNPKDQKQVYGIREQRFGSYMITVKVAPDGKFVEILNVEKLS